MGIIDVWTAKYDVIFLSEKRDVYEAVMEYIRRQERITGNRLRNRLLEGSGENRSDAVKRLSKLDGINIEYSPDYASKSKGIAEIFMEEI